MNAGRFLLAISALAVLLAVTGCGSSGSDDTTVAVAVQTGSLSKAEFIKKADAICEAARTEFLAKFKSFANAHVAEFSDPKQREAAFTKVLESNLNPNIEDQIEQISKLGAPGSYAPEVEAFLMALQKRLAKAEEDPLSLISTPYPFKKAEEVAKKAGMQGCSESFS